MMESVANQPEPDVGDLTVDLTERKRGGISKSKTTEEIEEIQRVSSSSDVEMQQQTLLPPTPNGPPSTDENAAQANIPEDLASLKEEGILAQLINRIKKHPKIFTFCVIITVIVMIYAGLIIHIFNRIGGNWSEWGNWAECSATCGHGLQSRTRTCSSEYCPGHNIEYQMCNVRCTDGVWSKWGDWSQCSATCGQGLQTRIRTCSGENCRGQNVESEMCNMNTCTGDIVAFSWKFKIQNGALTFLHNDKIYTHGNGFTSATGIFTCSIPGIYLFSVTLVKEETNSNLTCHLYKTEPYPSSNQLISLILNSSNFSLNSLSYASATVLVDLKVNDTMYLSGCSASSSSSKAYSVFSGVLLHKTI